LYGYALAKRKELELNGAETILTRMALGENLIYVGMCALSITLALLTTSSWLPGVIYMLLAPLQATNGWWFGRKVQALTTAR
jgi:hypothetical protein